MQNHELRVLVQEANNHIRILTAKKEHDAALENPGEELAKLKKSLDVKLTKAQQQSEIASQLARAQERLNELCEKWEGDKHLDILTRHYTRFSSWEDLATYPSETPKFDWRVVALRTLAEAYDARAVREKRSVSLKPYCGYFDGLGYDTITLEATIAEPPRGPDVKGELEDAIIQGELDVPHDFRLDSRAFVTERTRDIQTAMDKRWRKVWSNIEGHRIEEMKREMVEEHCLSRFSAKTVSALHSLAWDRGHSSGFDEVKSNYPDLVALLETTLA